MVRKFLLLATMFSAFCNISPATAQEKITVDAYCQYAGEQLADDIYGFESDAAAQAAVKRILDYTGLVQNFTIKAANVPNAAAVIQGDQRLILYSQQFMLSVAQIEPDWAAISIMAHEVGHHLQGHTIQAGGSRPSIELEADRYSGYVLQKMGASLAQAQAAINALVSDSGSSTHPPRSARLAAITNGWTAAEQISANAPPAGNPDSQPTTQSPLPSGQDPTTQTPTPTVTYVARVVFAGDAVPYFVTSTDDIVGVPPGGQPIIVGKRIPPTLPGFAWMYSTAQITYGVTPDGRVFSRNNFGVPFQVGYVTSAN